MNNYILKLILPMLMISLLISGLSICSLAKETVGDTNTSTLKAVNQTWQLDGDTLILSGDYNMENFYYPPWRNRISQIKKIILEPGITSIPDELFEYYTNLESITIPSTVKTIGKSAFSSCVRLKELYLPEGVETIGESAFSYCANLTEIHIPKSLKQIGYNAFWNYRLEKVHIADLVSWCEIDCKNLGSSPLSNQKAQLYLNGEPVTELVIPNGITEINSYTFPNQSQITTISFPDSLTIIHPYAFSGCGIKELTLPESLTELGGFDGSMIERVIFNESLNKISEHCFDGCTKLNNVQLPNSVTEIGEAAFQGCKSITAFTLPHNVTSISNSLFLSARNLDDIVLHDNVKSIGANAFNGTKYYDSPNWKGGLLYIGDYLIRSRTSINQAVYIKESTVLVADKCFEDCELLNELHFNKNLKYYGKNVLKGCTSLVILTLPDCKTIIEEKEFYEYKNLSTVTLGSNVQEIKAWAFAECTALEYINIPKGIKTIEGWAFFNCSLIRSIYLPSSLTNVDYYAFSKCTGIDSIYTDSIDFWFKTSLTAVVDYAQPYDLYINGDLLTDISLPLDVDSITWPCFKNCKSIKAVNVPSNIKYLHPSLFSGCLSLESVDIEEGIESFPYFGNCPKLISVTIPKTVTVMYSNIFANSPKLTVMCYANTAAYHYVIKNNIPHIILDKKEIIFDDVKEDTWYTEAVYYCVDRVFIQGTDKGKFEPNLNLTREQFVVILARMSGAYLTDCDVSSFKDVKADSWYAASIEWAYNNSLIKGVGDGTSFGIGRPISREELAVMFKRYADFKYINTEGRGDLSIFKDGDTVSSWAKDAVEWTIHTRLLGSTSTNEMILAPKMTVTRAQAAKIIMNFSK